MAKTKQDDREMVVITKKAYTELKKYQKILREKEDRKVSLMEIVTKAIYKYLYLEQN